MAVLKAIVGIGIVAVSGYLFGWIAKDSADRLSVHDRHYCTAIEGHTVAECEQVGR